MKAQHEMAFKQHKLTMEQGLKKSMVLQQFIEQLQGMLETYELEIKKLASKVDTLSQQLAESQASKKTLISEISLIQETIAVPDESSYKNAARWQGKLEEQIQELKANLAIANQQSSTQQNRI